MSTAFIDEKIKTIFEDDQISLSLRKAHAASCVIFHLKGIDVKILNVGSKSSLSDYFVLCSVDNTIQAKAVASEMSRVFKKYGKRAKVEGLQEASWILMDLDEVIVHIFLEPMRSVYDLESLWESAEKVSIPEEFYSIEKKSTSSDEDYTHSSEEGEETPSEKKSDYKKYF